MNIIKFIRQAQTSGGGSYNLVTGETNPTKGYMVSIRRRGRILSHLPTDDDIKAYIVDNIHYLVETVCYLGMWENEGRWYLDISVNVPTMADAVMLGKANDQLAIWDCLMNQSIDL